MPDLLNDMKRRAEDQRVDNMAQMLTRASSFHRAFSQNDDGRKVYHGWIQEILNAPPTLDTAELLRREGLRIVVKQITDNITIIEQRSEHG